MFEGHLYFGTAQWPGGETYEEEVWAAQYLHIALDPGHHIQTFTILRPRPTENC